MHEVAFGHLDFRAQQTLGVGFSEVAELVFTISGGLADDFSNLIGGKLLLNLCQRGRLKWADQAGRSPRY